MVSTRSKKVVVFEDEDITARARARARASGKKKKSSGSPSLQVLQAVARRRKLPLYPQYTKDGLIRALCEGGVLTLKDFTARDLRDMAKARQIPFYGFKNKSELGDILGIELGDIPGENEISPPHEMVSDKQQQRSLSQTEIEQLLVRTQFSREEGDRLIEIIKSRAPHISSQGSKSDNGFDAKSAVSEIEMALQNLKEEYERLKSDYEVLKKRCHSECCERKHLHNELISLKGGIRVFIRCRPMMEAGERNIICYDSCLDNQLKTVEENFMKLWKFDHVFRPEDNQESVFEQTSPLVVSVLDGYSVCIFAYGQSGTGKTFTMEGTAKNRGVNYRALEELFRVSKERSDIMKYQLSISALEVYNEKITDLLIEDPNNGEELKFQGTEVLGLTDLSVTDTYEVFKLLERGTGARSVGSTNVNEFSSRSHFLFRVTVCGESLVNGQPTRSCLWLVDLAGSERASKTGAEGLTLIEGNNINTSLFHLRKVIRDIVMKKKACYRNSKLTQLLESSLGGDCKTLMFVHISPSLADRSETVSSLAFARDARCIESGPARKQMLTPITKQKQQNTGFRLTKEKQLTVKAKHHGTQGTKKLIDKFCKLDIEPDKERKTRHKEEQKVIAVASSQPSKAKPNRVGEGSTRRVYRAQVEDGKH